MSTPSTRMRPSRDVVEPQQQVDQRRLARARSRRRCRRARRAAPRTTRRAGRSPRPAYANQTWSKTMWPDRRCGRARRLGDRGSGIAASASRRRRPRTRHRARIPSSPGSPRVAESRIAESRRDRHRRVEQLEDALGRGHRRLQDVELLRHVADRPEEALRVQQERDQRPERQRRPAASSRRRTR